MKKAVLFVGWFLLAVPCAGGIIIVDDWGCGDLNNTRAAIEDSDDADVTCVSGGT
jgi:hypothetical protein